MSGRISQFKTFGRMIRFRARFCRVQVDGCVLIHFGFPLQVGYAQLFRVRLWRLWPLRWALVVMWVRPRLIDEPIRLSPLEKGSTR